MVNLVTAFWVITIISTFFYEGILDKVIAVTGLLSSYLSISTANKILRCGRDDKRILLTFALSRSIAISSFWTLVFYPAIMSLDSVYQWSQAINNRYDSWHPPIMAILMRLMQFFSKDPALFAFGQGSIFWLSIFLALDRLTKSDKFYLISCTILALSPPLWPYTSTLWKDVWTCALAVLGVTFLLYAIEQKQNHNETRSRYYLVASLLFFGLAVAFRHNAITITVSVLMVIAKYIGVRKLWKNIIFLLLCFVLVVSPARIVSNLPGLQIEHRNPAIAHLLSMYLGTASRVRMVQGEESKERYRQSVDKIFGGGSFEKYSRPYPYGLFPYWEIPAKNKKQFDDILTELLKVVTEHPREFLLHRLYNLSLIFQIRHVSYPYHMGIDKNDLNLFENSRLPNLNRLIFSLLGLGTESFSSLWRTWFIFLVSIIVCLLHRRREMAITNSIGASYAFSYLLIDSYPDWRLLLLTYVCSLLCIICSLEGYRIVRQPL